MNWDNKDMTGLQYRYAIKRLGLSRAASARFFRVGESTAMRWAKDKTEIPAAVAMLLRAMIEADFKPKAPRWRRGS